MTYHPQQGVDTCIARIFNTYGPRMRRNDGRASVNFLNQALDGQAAHGLRRRLADALALLRRRSDPRPLPACDERRAPAGEPRQPRPRGDDARARADRDPRHGLDERDRLRGAADRRPAGPAPRHHARAPGARLGARDRPRGGPPPLAAGARPGAGRRPDVRRVGVIARRRADGAPRCDRAARARVALSCASASTTRRRRSTARSTRRSRCFKQLHVQEVRLNLYWGGPYGVATDAAGARDEPDRPGLRLGRSTTAPSTTQQQYGVHVLFSIYGTPSWANGGTATNVAPTKRDRPAQLRATPPRSATAARTSAPTGDPAGGQGVARLERAEQPDLPHAAVQARPRTAGRSRARPTTRRSATPSTTASTRRCARASVSPAASPRRAATTTRPARARPSRRSRSCARRRRRG